MLQRAASNAYSWWWASHIRTKQSKWMEQNLQGEFMIFMFFLMLKIMFISPFSGLDKCQIEIMMEFLYILMGEKCKWLSYV